MFINRLTQKSDEELLLQVQQGEERALTALYERYNKKIMRYFYRMLWKDRAKAQDFLHDLFVKVIENPHRIDAGKRFSTWLYSVAHNMCKNEYRRLEFRRATNGNVAPPVILENSIHEELDHRDFMNILEKVIEQWEEDDRSLFAFRHELEMTFVEIAAVMNCPEGTVKSRWFYLKKKLALHVQAYHPILK